MPRPEQVKHGTAWEYPPSLKDMTATPWYQDESPLEQVGTLKEWDFRFKRALMSNKTTVQERNRIDYAIKTGLKMQEAAIRQDENNESRSGVDLLFGGSIAPLMGWGDQTVLGEDGEYKFPENWKGDKERIKALNHIHDQLKRGVYKPYKDHNQSEHIQKKIASKFLDGIYDITHNVAEDEDDIEFDVLDHERLTKQLADLVANRNQYVGLEWENSTMKYIDEYEILTRQIKRAEDYKSWTVQFMKERMLDREGNAFNPKTGMPRLRYDKIDDETGETVASGSTESTMKPVESEPRKKYRELTEEKTALWEAVGKLQANNNISKEEKIAKNEKLMARNDAIGKQLTELEKVYHVGDTEDAKYKIERRWNVDGLTNRQLKLQIKILEEGKYDDLRYSPATQKKMASELDEVLSERPKDHDKNLASKKVLTVDVDPTKPFDPDAAIVAGVAGESEPFDKNSAGYDYDNLKKDNAARVAAGKKPHAKGAEPLTDSTGRILIGRTSKDWPTLERYVEKMQEERPDLKVGIRQKPATDETPAHYVIRSEKKGKPGAKPGDFIPSK